ncbi:hypothetical protein Q7P35_005790 [Cladosporium inversicolor]
MATQTPSHSHLYGSCACERNQYEIAIPQSHAQYQNQPHAHAHVFFDNSRANRRSQAAPLTAWLRIPLAWYHSNTQAFFPDESHAAIRRTFYTPGALVANNGSGGKDVRKQFCGFCGTHLNAWRERDGEEEEEWMDVTLGSLWGESLGVLERLGWFEDESSGEEDVGERAVRRRTAGSMSNRGMPYFEGLVEDSKLGKIKRRRGGHVDAEGREVQWEVTEIEGGDGNEDTVMESAVEVGNGNKRLKMGD